MEKKVEDLLACVNSVQDREQKLVIVTGNPGSGKSKVLREVSSRKRWDYIDCRDLVSDEIIELLPSMRAAQAPSIMSEVLAQYESDILILDRVQTLFTPVLHLDPLLLLRKLSEKYTLIVAWPGYYENENLFFLRSGEPEPMKFDAKGLIVWSVE